MTALAQHNATVILSAAKDLDSAGRVQSVGLLQR